MDSLNSGLWALGTGERWHLDISQLNRRLSETFGQRVFPFCHSSSATFPEQIQGLTLLGDIPHSPAQLDLSVATSSRLISSLSSHHQCPV